MVKPNPSGGISIAVHLSPPEYQLRSPHKKGHSAEDGCGWENYLRG